MLRGTLADIADQVEAAGLRQAAVILVSRALAARSDAACVAESHLYDPARRRPVTVGSVQSRTDRRVQTRPVGVTVVPVAPTISRHFMSIARGVELGRAS